MFIFFKLFKNKNIFVFTLKYEALVAVAVETEAVTVALLVEAMLVVKVIKNSGGGKKLRGNGGVGVGGNDVGGDFVNKIKISFCYFYYF